MKLRHLTFLSLLPHADGKQLMTLSENWEFFLIQLRRPPHECCMDLNILNNVENVFLFIQISISKFRDIKMRLVFTLQFAQHWVDFLRWGQIFYYCF